MSVKQRNAANARKEAMKTVYVARLVDNPTSPRKTRIMANVIRGKNVDYAMNVLKFSRRESSEKLLKLLKSAVANWQVYIKTIMVDGGRMLKRIRTAPQGRAARIRKRSNHVTLILGDRNEENVQVANIEESQK